MLPSGLPEQVADEEELARFLTSSNHFKGEVVKSPAFLPNPKDGKKSVFRHGAKPREVLQSFARERMDPEVTVYGAAICTAAQVRSAELEVEAQEPPPRHANIINWPTNPDPVLQKAQQKDVANVICSRCILVRFDSLLPER